MPIRFHIPATATEQVAFATSPLLEAVLSLHALVEPKHHPLHHPWIRRARTLPASLRRDWNAFSFVYREYFPGFFFPCGTCESEPFERELAALGDISDDMLRLEFTRSFVDGNYSRDPQALNDPAIRAAILERAGGDRNASVELVTCVLETPRIFLDRFSQFLRSYWDEAFAEEWHKREPLLDDVVADVGARIVREGLYGFFATLPAELHIDRAKEIVSKSREHDHDISIPAGEYLTLAPSYYAWPHVYVNCDEPWPLGIVYPAVKDAHSGGPVKVDQLSRLLRGFSDETRLRALRLIAERPRSTQELAPLIHVSEAALSKHLRLLTDAGILHAERDGYYVLYSLATERVQSIADTLNAFLLS